MIKLPKALLLFIASVFFSCLLFGQNKSVSDLFHEQLKNKYVQIDSLKDRINKVPSDTARVRLYHIINSICKEEDLLHYGEPMLALCDKIITETKDSAILTFAKKEKVIALRSINKRYGFGTSKSLEILNKCLIICKELKDREGVVDTKIDIANVYANQGNIMKQLLYLKDGLKVTKEMGDKRGMDRFIRQLQFLYATQGDTAQAINFINKSLLLEKESGDSLSLAPNYISLAYIYFSIKHYNDAIDNYKKSIDSYKANNNVKALPSIFIEIGKVYAAKNDYAQGIKYCKLAYETAQENKDPEWMFFSLINLGTTYAQLGDFKNAIATHLDALKEAEALNFDGPKFSACRVLAPDYFSINDFANAKKYSERALKILPDDSPYRYKYDVIVTAYKIDSALNNYKGAFHYFQQSILLKKQLNSEEVNKTAAKEKFQDDMEKQKFELDAEQKRKDLITDQEKARQRIVLYSVCAGLILVIALALLIYRGYAQKQKINNELASKNAIIEQQKYSVEEKHKEITDSINYAERIQRSFLATKEILDENLSDYFVFFKPKDIVSGDFYWASELNNGNFIFATADSTGHGVPGAIMSILNITCLEKSVEEEKLSEPAEILNHTRTNIIKRLKQDGSAEGGKDGMDCCLLVLDSKNKKLTVAAAYNPIWIVRTSAESLYKEVIVVKPDKMPVGKHDNQNISFTQQEVDLQSGDMIYTLTDGFSDQFGGANGKKFKSKNLRELLVANSHLPMQQQKQLLETTFINWVGAFEQVDDVTIIGIKV